jgi:hypothetical protein
MPRKQKQKQKQKQSVTVNINQGRTQRRRRRFNRSQQQVLLQNPQVRHVFNDYASLFHTVVHPKPLPPQGQDITVSEQKAVSQSPAALPAAPMATEAKRDHDHRSSHRSRHHTSPEPSRRKAIAQLREGLLDGLRSAGAAAVVNPERVAAPISFKSELPSMYSGPPDLSDYGPPQGRLPRRRDLNSPGIPERVMSALDNLRGMSSEDRQHQLRGSRLRETAKRLYIPGYTGMNTSQQRAAINDLLGPSYQ